MSEDLLDHDWILDPLLKSHRVRLTETGMAPPFSVGLHAVPVVASEFSGVLRDHPVVFLRRPHDGSSEAMAILGIQEGQNMFVMPDGRWDRRTYISAYIRRYPFSMAPAPSACGGSERVVCVDRRRCPTAARACSTTPAHR